MSYLKMLKPVYTNHPPPPRSATEAGDHVTDDVTAAVPAQKLKRRSFALYTPGL